MLPLGRCSSRLASPFKKLHLQKKLLFAFSFSTATNHDDEGKPSRPSPPPIRVSLTESAGRGVFATRRIGAGDLIHTAKPLVSHPSLSSIDSVCYFCLRKLENAANCQAQSVTFCSEQCREEAKVFYGVERKADWSAYDDYCRIRGLKYPLLVRRLACMVISGVASADCIDILQPASLSPDMILEIEEKSGRSTNRSKRRLTGHAFSIMMEGEFGLLRNALTKANIMDEQMAFLTKQWYTSMLARIRINAFRIELPGGLYEDLLKSAAATVEAEFSVGNAVYMLPSFYNHDCEPNAHIIWIKNVDARLKALRDIEAGEELRICYIDTSMDRDARQTLLREGFGFQCCCPRCLSGD